MPSDSWKKYSDEELIAKLRGSGSGSESGSESGFEHGPAGRSGSGSAGTAARANERGPVGGVALGSEAEGGGNKESIDAFEAIFHKYYPMILIFLTGLLKNRTEAEDIAQDCFMKLWYNRMSLNPKLNLKNWLYVIARNEAFNLLNSARSRNVPIEIKHDSHSPLLTVDDWINFSETSLQLNANIDSLPPQRRMIFKMSRFEHLSNMDIAIKTNLSVRTVEKHIELALKDLRKNIDNLKIN